MHALYLRLDNHSNTVWADSPRAGTAPHIDVQGFQLLFCADPARTTPHTTLTYELDIYEVWYVDWWCVG